MGQGNGHVDQEDGDYRCAMVRGRQQGETMSVAGVQQAEPQGMAQGLGEAGEEVTSVGREKRLPTETEAWVCFLAISVSVMSNVRAQHRALWGLQSCEAHPKESPSLSSN